MNHVQLNFLLFFTILQMCEKRHFSCFSCFHEFVKNTQIQRICKSRILPNGEERMLLGFCAMSSHDCKNNVALTIPICANVVKHETYHHRCVNDSIHSTSQKFCREFAQSASLEEFLVQDVFGYSYQKKNNNKNHRTRQSNKK